MPDGLVARGRIEAEVTWLRPERDLRHAEISRQANPADHPDIVLRVVLIFSLPAICCRADPALVMAAKKAHLR